VSKAGPGRAVDHTPPGKEQGVGKEHCLKLHPGTTPAAPCSALSAPQRSASTVRLCNQPHVPPVAGYQNRCQRVFILNAK